MSEKTKLQMIEDRVKHLPLIEGSVSSTLSLLDNPQVNFHQVIEKISPGVAARFLDIANSTATKNREVRSLNHAVKMLGFEKMKRILSTSMVVDSFAKQSDFDYFSFNKFDRQAHFCAVFSNLLGQIVNYERQEDLFTASILHNIGKLIIAVHFKDDHQKIIHLKKTKGISTTIAERTVLAADHAEIGALAMQQLNIPKDICDAIRFHNCDDPIPRNCDFQMLMICREASRMIGGLELPEKIDLTNIKTQLQNIIESSRKAYHNRLRFEIRSKGYREFFPELLKIASKTVYDGIEQVFKRRTRLRIIPENR